MWIDLNIFEAVVGSLFYQFSLYVALRLAHRGFTLGELGLTCFGATAIGLEFLNLTIARVSVIYFCCDFWLIFYLQDLASNDAVYSDISSAHTFVDFPDSFDCRIIANRIPSLTFPGVIEK